jgi:hypothetical protein
LTNSGFFGEFFCGESELKVLAEHLLSRLAARSYWVVFEAELDGIWPREKYSLEERRKQIEAFAQAYGLDVSIWDSGLRAIFKRKSAKRERVAD